MDLRLHLLDSFMAQGPDGSRYKVCAYERMVRDVSLPLEERWEPTGITEYRLEDGRPVHMAEDGSLEVSGAGLRLQREHESTLH